MLTNRLGLPAKILLILTLAFSPLVFAQAQSVSDIKIVGNKKIEKDAVVNKLVSKIGQNYSLDKVSKDVKALFKTGYFNDIIVDKKIRGGKVVLTYTLVEKPSVTEISFDGNDELNDDELAEGAGIRPYEILDMSKVSTAVEKIEKLYEDKGFFLARVKFQVDEIEKDEAVRLKFIINENEKVKVKAIRIIGNRELPAGQLKTVMETKEGGFFSFMSGSGAYKQDAFDRDVQRLNYYYFNEGFVQAKVDRPQVYVTPDKKSIFITIRVEEGQRFNVGSVDFTGDLLFTIDEMTDATVVKEGEQFVYEEIQKDLRSLQAKYGDLGYAFTNIIPRTRVREKDKEVDITYEIDKGQKVYIGKINVKGNSKTRDKVVRRELRVREGELYNETRKRESMANIRRLGFFDEVNFNTKTPDSNSNIMDIDIVVKERNTGSIQVGAGYSSFSGFILNGQINQINLFGRGQKLGASVDIADKRQTFNVSFTEPYFRDTLWSLGFDLYQRKRELTQYNESKIGGAIRVGHPLAPYLNGYLSYKLDNTDLSLTEDGDEDIYPVETANGRTSSTTASLIYDKRDDRFAPTDGIYSSASLEYAGLGGSLKYTKGGVNFRYYKTVFWDVVWRNNISYGFISSNKEGQEPPFNQLYLLGGANSLRGYEWFSVGKRKRSQKAYDQAISDGKSNDAAEEIAKVPFGGTQQLFYNLEFQFPLIREAGVKGVVFYDVGNADDSLGLGDFRSDVGFGFRWFSPIGPLRFEWGFPTQKIHPDEEDVNFEFAIGSPF